MKDGSDTEVFESFRARLFGIAYRMLGSVAEAEDVVQDAWLRWHGTEASAVRHPEAWLVAVTSRLSIDRLRRLNVEKAAYSGSWLPEPIATGPARADRQAEMASDLSMAFLVLLERLAPDERLAFILRDVFDVGYDEIAALLDRSEVACRQVVRRARERVRRDRPRQTVTPDVAERLVGRFLSALHDEDSDALVALLTDATTFTSDGGGRVPAARNVLIGPDRISRFLLGLARKGRGIVTHRIAWLNGEPAILSFLDGRPFCTTSIETVDGEHIVAFYRVLNPAKLGRAIPAPAVPNAD